MLLTRTDTLSEILQRGSIRDADVAQLCRVLDADPHSGLELIEQLLRIDATCRVQDANWLPFLVETVTRYIVLEAEPSGYVNATKVDWLVGRITRNGRIERASVVELLVETLGRARWAPATLSALVIRHVAQAVRSGNGACRAGLSFDAGHLTLAEIGLVRRVLLAYGANGHQPVTGAEAHAVLDVELAQGERDRHFIWNDLCIKVLLAYAMDISNCSAGPRALTLGAAYPADIAARYQAHAPEGAVLAELERQRLAIITGEAAPDDEADHLADRLLAAMTPTVAAFVDLFAAHCRAPHPAFTALVHRHRAAA